MNTDPLEPRPHLLSQRGGRVIAWHEFGQLKAPAATVIYCHGTPGTGYEALFLDEAAQELGIRIIAPDRPGLGASDAVPHRLVGTWAKQDVAAIIEHLELDRFSVVGFSGGGPHAMSLAALHPEKVDQLILLAPYTHHPLWESRLGLNFTPLRVHLSHFTLSWLPKPLIDLTACTLSRPLASASTLADALGRRVQGRTAAYRMATSHDYALQFSVAGGVQDEYAIQGDWGFSESTLKTPVHLFVAGRDLAIKSARARNLGLRLGARIYELPSDGHFSLLINRAADVLAPALQRTVN